MMQCMFEWPLWNEHVSIVCRGPKMAGNYMWPKIPFSGLQVLLRLFLPTLHEAEKKKTKPHGPPPQSGLLEYQYGGTACKFCRLHRGWGWQSSFVEPTKLTRCTSVERFMKELTRKHKFKRYQAYGDKIPTTSRAGTSTAVHFSGSWFVNYKPPLWTVVNRRSETP